MNDWRSAESAAVRYLTRRLWQPVARNWRGAGGEIDIAARRLGVLAIVEVKSRGDADALLEPVRRDQRARIIRAACAFVAARPELQPLALRFDVITIDLSHGSRRIRHIAHAFSPEDPRTAATRRDSGRRPTEMNAGGWE